VQELRRREAKDASERYQSVVTRKTDGVLRPEELEEVKR
jgi:hypothetical protein